MMMQGLLDIHRQATSGGGLTMSEAAKFEVLATFQEEVVAVRQGKHIGISCHPELLDETLIHEICFKGKNEIS